MTDFELLTIFIEFINTTWTIFATYVSIVFAFLIAGYLVAKNLSAIIVSLVVTLYSLVAFWSVWALNRNVVAISATSREMKEGILSGQSSLGWFPMASAPEYLFVALPALVTLIAVVAYAGSIFFFFYQRKHDSQN
ncbi:MAG: hypothetical protein O2971_12875 [Proteobacteria bacterium]|nr:hypothetical protein [Pseudomonadota bacterium]